MNPMVTAVVTLTVQIRIQDQWGPDCTMRQLLAQAKESALRAVSRGIQPAEDIKLLGETVIEIVKVKP